MPAYPCPKCRVPIDYPVSRWTPWRLQTEFRCPHCATMVQRIHMRRSQFAKFTGCLAFTATEFGVLIWNRSVLYQGDRQAIIRLGWLFILILVIYEVLMRWLTRYRLVARQEITSQFSGR